MNRQTHIGAELKYELMFSRPVIVQMESGKWMVELVDAKGKNPVVTLTNKHNDLPKPYTRLETAIKELVAHGWNQDITVRPLV